jgi:hypothetical protein
MITILATTKSFLKSLHDWVYEEHYSFRDGGGIWSGGFENEDLERVNIEDLIHHSFH